MIIAVDYDGTLEINGEINKPLLSRIRAQQRNDDFIILWTSRTGENLRKAIAALSNAGFRANAVNENAPQYVARTGSNPRKIFADMYIDDKAVRP